ncbi:hypothetical protein [Nocardia sp. NPDC057668]|uniref:hypothetical protein n=1 Tax=Nocardia sp. NPDC057668 TaxID=3346202 RepID=UPI00366CBD51
MSYLRACAVLTAVPALLAFGSGTAAAQPGESVPLDQGRGEPAAQPVAASGTLRVGSETVQLPVAIDAQALAQAQSYVDGVQAQVGATFDRLGRPRSEPERRAAGAEAGRVIGAVIGKVVVFPLEIVGCGVGATIGAVAGGVIGGLPTVGAGVPVGAAVGGVAGCLLGGLAVAIPVDIAGLVGGGAIGEFVGGALGAATAADPAAAPGADAAAAQPVSIETRAGTPEPLAVAPVADAIAAAGPDAEAAVTSLRTAVKSMPKLGPDALGPLTQPANDLFAAVQAAL